MKAILYQNNKVYEIIEDVTEIGKDFVVSSDMALRGINTDIINVIAVDDDIKIRKGDSLPSDLKDKKSLLHKANLEDIGKELTTEKIKNMQLKSIVDALGEELAKTKVQLIQMKGVGE